MVVSASTMFTTTNGEANTACHKKRVSEYFVNITVVHIHTHTHTHKHTHTHTLNV